MIDEVQSSSHHCLSVDAEVSIEIVNVTDLAEIIDTEAGCRYPVY